MPDEREIELARLEREENDRGEQTLALKRLAEAQEDVIEDREEADRRRLWIEAFTAGVGRAVSNRTADDLSAFGVAVARRALRAFDHDLLEGGDVREAMRELRARLVGKSAGGMLAIVDELIGPDPSDEEPEDDA